VAQEDLYSTKSKKIKGTIFIIDLLKAYDRVNWLYIRPMLTRLGFHIGFFLWIMSCLTSVSFVALINAEASPFFHSERELRQGCPLSPLLSLLVAEGVGRYLKKTNFEGNFRGLPLSQVMAVTHLLFVDDILIFCDGSFRDINQLCHGLDLFKRASGMLISEEKYSITWANLEDHELRKLEERFNFRIRYLDEGVKYLGFQLNPNDYRKSDWFWLLAKLEKRISIWIHRWLSRAGCLVLC